MRNKLLPTVLMFFLFTTTSFGAIAEHILYVQLAQYWGYGNAASPNLQYSFAFTVEADNTVEHIEFLTPGGTEGKCRKTCIMLLELVLILNKIILQCLMLESIVTVTS